MIRIVKQAQQELDEAFSYYEYQLVGLGLDFIDEFEKALNRIELFPDGWQSYTKNTRRCLFCRFPYSIIYLKNFSDIIIIAVAHSHRKPNYWKNRIRKID